MTSLRPRSFLIAGLLAIGAVASAGGVQYARSAAATPQPKKQLYRCPMHPQVMQDHPGRCPICGMNLVLVTPSSKSTSLGQGSGPGGCCGQAGAGTNPEPSK